MLLAYGRYVGMHIASVGTDSSASAETQNHGRSGGEAGKTS